MQAVHGGLPCQSQGFRIGSFIGLGKRPMILVDQRDADGLGKCSETQIVDDFPGGAAGQIRDLDGAGLPGDDFGNRLLHHDHAVCDAFPPVEADTVKEFSKRARPLPTPGVDVVHDLEVARIAKPAPLPMSLVVKNGSKTRARSSFGMPMPVSRTVSRT